MEKEKLRKLAEHIQNSIYKEFEEKHLSGNLMNTMFIKDCENGYELHIPAEIYNMYQYFTHNVVIPTGKGSYASQLNEEGSAFMVYEKGKKRRLVKPRNHIGYIEKAIDEGVDLWSKENLWQIQKEKR